MRFEVEYKLYVLIKTEGLRAVKVIGVYLTNDDAKDAERDYRAQFPNLRGRENWGTTIFVAPFPQAQELLEELIAQLGVE